MFPLDECHLEGALPATEGSLALTSEIHRRGAERHSSE